MFQTLEGPTTSLEDGGFSVVCGQEAMKWELNAHMGFIQAKPVGDGNPCRNHRERAM